ncbi:MAG: hypothetical protein BGN83_15975 [Rhizobium sp. 63-7]|nr:MAG: hypothetical protein BGN83_15975 [Rhizobium sp. 63-7]
MRLIFSKKASRYLRRERAYIAQFDARAAEVIMRQFQAAFRTLQAYPNAGAAVLPLAGRRRFVVGAYVVDYRVDDDLIEISAIKHGRQHDPATEVAPDADYEGMPED